MWGEFLWNFELLAKGVTGGTPYDKINPILWYLLVFEVIVIITVSIIKYRLTSKK